MQPVAGPPPYPGYQQQGQPQYPPYPPSPPPRPKSSPERLILIIAVVVVVVALVLAVATPLVLRAVAAPSVTVSNATYGEGYCYYGQPYVTFQMTLTNSGDADGIAQVSFYQDNVRLGSEQWTVPAHNSVDQSASYSISSCGGHSYTYTLDAVTKG